MAGRIRDKLLSWKILTFFWNEDRIVFLYFHDININFVPIFYSSFVY